jgi:outer membrane lipoprotein-sorting protein
MKIYENNKIKETVSAREWIDNSNDVVKRRIELKDNSSGTTISTNDGKNIIVYIKEQKQAMTMSLESPAANGADDVLGGNYKNQLLKQLAGMSKTHNITFQGEENVLDRKAYHIKAEPKQKDTILGTLDYWVDEESWIVSKAVTASKNSKTEIQYSKLDFSPKLDSSLFSQKLPDNIKVENMNNQIKNSENVITLDEAVKLVGKPILYLPEGGAYKLKDVKSLHYDKSEGVNEINQSYEKDGAVAFVLTEVNPKDTGEKSDDAKLPGEKEMQVRGKKGSVMDDTIKTVSWSEDGFNYNILLQDPKMSLDDAVKIADSLLLKK